jgi:hypothetical protein
LRNSVHPPDGLADFGVRPPLHLRAGCSLRLFDLARPPSLVAPRFKQAIEAIIHGVDPPLFILFNSHKYFPSGEWVTNIGWIEYFLLKKYVNLYPVDVSQNIFRSMNSRQGSRILLQPFSLKWKKDRELTEGSFWQS